MIKKVERPSFLCYNAKKKEVNKMQAIELQKQYGVSSLTAAVLSHAGLNNKQVEQVLFPKNSLTLCQCEAIDRAVERIQLAKKRKEKVFIGGDYDADGICATTIMKETLDELGIENGFYIPNRFTQGYGLHPDTVRMVKERGYSLIITVDNGVAQEESIELCHELGLQILVTDHHTISKTLNWDYLVHPTVLPEGFQSLCGAGVALELSMRLIGEKRRHVILAMVATLADMMPVFDENRWIIRKGLEYLNEDRMPQLEALLDRPVKSWNEKEVTFQIVPKINAVGRLADVVNANNMVRYFLLNSMISIEETAKQIKEVNQERRKMSEKMAETANAMVQNEPFILVSDESFHEGLVGLVANKLMMNLKKPTAVFSIRDGIYKGSVRSFGNLDLIDFFEEFKPMLEQFGGHRAAAGISVRQQDFETFKKSVLNKMNTIEIQEIVEDTIQVDSRFCTVEAIKELKKISPFGQGFDHPTFEITNFEVMDTVVLKDRFPKWRCFNDLFEFEAISFTLPKDSILQPIRSLKGTLEINEFRGRKTVSILVDSIKEK